MPFLLVKRMEETIKIPSSRIAVLIGKNGKNKRKIGALADCTLSIDSKTGEVTVKAKKNGKNFYNALNIIRAIGRGFSPEKAFLLLDENFLLEVLNLADFLGKKQLEAKKGRIIGREGKAREELEKKTDCHISVSGKKIAIIGKAENIAIARKAIEMLLEGASHASVFRFVERKTTEQEEFEI